MLKIEYAVLFGVIGMFATIIGLWKALKKDTSEETATMTTFKSDIKNIGDNVKTIANDTKEIRVENREIRDRLVRVETINEQTQARLKKLERN